MTRVLVVLGLSALIGACGEEAGLPAPLYVEPTGTRDVGDGTSQTGTGESDSPTAPDVESGGGEPGAANEQVAGNTGTDAGTDDIEEPTFENFQRNPSEFVREDCSGFDHSQLVFPGRFGSQESSILVNLHMDTLEVLGACGALALNAEPQRGRWGITPAGRVIFIWINNPSQFIHLLTPEVPNPCGEGCRQFPSNFPENDTLLSNFSEIAVHPSQDYFIYRAEDGYRDEVGVVAERIPPDWELLGLLESGAWFVKNARILDYGVWEPGDTDVRTGPEDVLQYGDTVVDFQATTDGMFVATQGADASYLGIVDDNGIYTSLGSYPPEEEGLNTDSAGGTLDPRGCLYSHAKGPGKIGVLVKRCTDGTRTVVGEHAPCDQLTSFCVI